MQAQYNSWIVALSFAVAVFASYLALEMAARVGSARKSPTAGLFALPIAAAMMGTGVWSMHFVAMLAMTLPVPVPYSVPITFLSLGCSIGAAYIALRVIQADKLSWRRLGAGGVLMGGGIILMHYTGMAALQIMPRPSYDYTLWALSAVIAIAAASAALWICFNLKSNRRSAPTRFASALAMGFAIWGMHFTGMAAVRFAPGSYCVGNPLTIDNSWLAGTVAFCVLGLLASLPLVTAINARLSRHDGISLRHWSRAAYVVNGALLALVATLTILLFLGEDVPTKAAQQAHKAHVVADDLAQAADDLARAARQFVATDDAAFEEMHSQILAIHNGTSPRPIQYDRSYWIRMASDPKQPLHIEASAVPLKERLAELTLTSSEQTLISQSERALGVELSLEKIAFDAMRGRFHGNDGTIINGAPDRDLARALLFDNRYLQARADVLVPLAEFQRSVDARSDLVVRNADRRTDLILSLMLVSLSALLCSLGLTYLVTKRKVASLLDLEQNTRRFGEAGFEFAVPQGIDEISQLGRTFATIHLRVTDRSRELEREIAERVRAEEESQRFFNQSLNLLLVAGFDGRYRQLNPAWEAVLGFKRDYLFERPFMQFVHEDDRSAVLQAIEHIQRGGKAVTVECRCLCADGTYKSFAWNATPRGDGDGDTFYATGHDITALRNIERSVSLSEERFRRVVEAAPNGMVMADQEGRIVLVNSQTEAMFGWNRSELLGQPVEVLIPERLRSAHPGHRHGFVARPEARAMGGNKELLARRHDASEFPVEIGINPISGSEGMMILCSIVDITERKRAERELRSSELQLQTIVENLAEGVVVSDMKGQLLHFNRSAMAMHGFSDVHEGLKHLSEFPNLFNLASIDGKLCQLDDWPLSRALRGEVIKDLEIRVRRTDRDSWNRVLSYNASAVPGPDGRPMLMVLTLSDVTDRRRTEAERHQAQKLESVGRLAAGVAHEINSPVQYINDCCHFVRDGVVEMNALVSAYRETLSSLASGNLDINQALKDTGQLEHDADVEYLLENMPGAMDRSLEGLQRVAAIVRSMKEFAHPDQKEKVHADLNQAINSTLTIARHEYKYVADVVTDLGVLPLVPCYLGDLNQAVLNLVVNAAHAIESVVRGTDQKGLIRIVTRVDGDEAVIDIEDNGCGIPEEIRDKIFDPFFTTKSIGKGTGQGLAITRSVIVDMHKGSIEVDSQPGEGTRFSIRLPLEPLSETVES